MASIRPYQPADRDDVYRICVLTGDSGGDATGMLSDDDLLPDIFAGPYLAYQPDLAFVVDAGDHVAGYIISVADTEAFARTTEAGAPVSYYKQIRPIFQAHCQGCHQPAKAGVTRSWCRRAT